MDTSKINLIAYYLPQYYEIEFNNHYWGKGYTEWTVTAKAKAFFKGHYQPHVPADLGFYNLLMPEAREAQAQMAKDYGVDGFCYWHYWFGNGRTIMEKPIQAVLTMQKPDFPFCFCWANHSWHNPATKEQILEQTYPGIDDFIAHFNYVLDFFKDHRYITIEGKPVFGIFEPSWMPDLDAFIDLWNKLALKAGFQGMYFVGIAQTPEAYEKVKDSKLDAINTVRLKDFLSHQNPWKEYLKYKFGAIHDYKYIDAQKYFITEQDRENRVIPTIIPGWDHSPRSGRNGLILTDYTPDAFEVHVRTALEVVSKKENKLCFIKAWNGWGEGNHLEPDLKYGKTFLEVLKKVKAEYKD